MKDIKRTFPINVVRSGFLHNSQYFRRKSRSIKKQQKKDKLNIPNLKDCYYPTLGLLVQI